MLGRRRSPFLPVTFTVVMLAGLGRGGPSAAAVADPRERSYSGGRFALELGGVVTGWIQSVEGGGAVGEVVTVRTGNGPDSKKHIARPKFEDITISFATPVPAPLLAWMRDTLAGTLRRQGGAVLTADYDGRVVERLEFSDALMTEVVFPRLDGSSRELAELSITLRPERTRFLKGSGTLRIDPPRATKPALVSSFRLSLDGLPATRVVSIEALAVRVKLAESDVGSLRVPTVAPVSVEVSNLIIRLPLADADAYTGWLEDFVVNGNSGDDRERGGTLELLAADATKLVTVTFHHLGIVRASRERRESGAERVAHASAEMYLEQLSLDAK